jgi:hypothetical protein
MPIEGFDDADIPPELAARMLEELERAIKNTDQDMADTKRDSGRRSGRGNGAVIDYGIVERSAGVGCSREEIAAIIGIARSAFYRHIDKDEKLRDALDVGAAKGRATLRRAQWKGAVTDGNPTMLVWLGKQLLGQQDSLALTADLNIHRVLSEAPLTIEQWNEMNVEQLEKPDEN